MVVHVISRLRVRVSPCPLITGSHGPLSFFQIFIGSSTHSSIVGGATLFYHPLFFVIRNERQLYVYLGTESFDLSRLTGILRCTEFRRQVYLNLAASRCLNIHPLPLIRTSSLPD